MLRVSVFGPFACEPRVGLREVDEKLLAFLCLQHGERALKRTEIADILQIGTGRVRSVLMRLRHQLIPLGASFCPNQSEELWLDENSISLDYAEFERHMGQIGREPESSVEHFLRAMGLAQKPLLSSWDDPWVIEERAELENTLWAAYRKLTAARICKSMRAGNLVLPLVHSAVRRLSDATVHGAADSPEWVLTDFVEELGRQKRFDLANRVEESLRRTLANVGIPWSRLKIAIKKLFQQIHEAASRFPLKDIGTLPSAEHLLELWSLQPMIESIMDHRVTIVIAPPGFGKSSYALMAAQHLKHHRKEEFPGGIWRINLEDIAGAAASKTGECVVAEIVKTCELPTTKTRPSDLARDFPSGRRLLLLDSCEAVPTHCSAVVNALSTRLDIRILATSQSPLDVDDQCKHYLPPLDIPPANYLGNLADLAKYPSVRLFIELARRNGCRNLTDGSVPDLLRIARLSKGIPMVISFGASLVQRDVNDSGLPNVADTLQDLYFGGDDVAFLRRRISRAVELLSDSARKLFPRLGVFSGGWTRELAESICSEQTFSRAEVSSALNELHSKSLVQHSSEGDRFSFLDMVRAFARERLRTEGMWDHMCQIHFGHFRIVAEFTARISTKGMGHKHVQQIDAESENIYAALNWAIAHSPVEGAKACLSLLYYWAARGNVWNGQGWLERFWKLDSTVLPADVRGLILHGQGVFAYLKSQYWIAMRRCKQSLQCEQLGREHPANVLNLVLIGMGEFHVKKQYGIALSRFREAVDIALRNNYDFQYTIAAGNLALHLADPRSKEELGSDPAWRDDTIRYGEEGVSKAKALGNLWATAFALMNQASALRHLDFSTYSQKIGELYREALQIRASAQDLYGEIQTLYKLAAVACAMGQYARSAIILGGLGNLLGRGIDIPRHNKDDYDWTIKETRANLGSDYDHFRNIGAQRPFRQVVSFALGYETTFG